MKNNIFKKYLKPHLVDGMTLKRFGSEYDGGYVMPLSILSNITKLISIGIGDNMDFEESLSQKNQNLQIYAFDHTITALPSHHIDSKKITFIQKGLGSKESMLDINQIYSYCDIKSNDTILLKIDAEGSEWRCNLEKATFQKTACIIIELHALIRKYKYDYYEKCLQQLTAKHLCVHVHGNNSAGLFNIDTFNYPGIIEITLVNKSIIHPFQYAVSPFDCPRYIDQTNTQSKKELVFNYWS